MPTESSRKPSETAAPAGCPRCAARLRERYKYCPNCAYRLRPELFHASPKPERPPPLTHRLVALGGYLAFASMLLAVIYAGFQLFAMPDTAGGPERIVTRARDANSLALSEASFALVERGDTHEGLYVEREDDPSIPEIYRVDNSFLLCRHEVTNDQYYEFLLARARKGDRGVADNLYPKSWTKRTGNARVRRIYDPHTGDHPITGVGFQLAVEFCAWFWEEKLNADPDRIVDLPTWLEYLRAARGDRFDRNFPWDAPEDAKAVLDGEPLAVTNPRIGNHGGFKALVGNVAEWVHGPIGAVAAGWSHLDYDRTGTPFATQNWKSQGETGARPDVGFRLLIRPAPAVPTFVRVQRGLVHHVSRPERLVELVDGAFFELLPPWADIEEDEEPRRAEVTFTNRKRHVQRDFDIATTEITNRQFLFFLTSVAPDRDKEVIESWIPSSWWRWERGMVFPGPYGDPDKIEFAYSSGHENRPVEGVAIEAAEAYAVWLGQRFSRRCRIPTVAQYLRAGRGDGRSPYPWGDNQGNPMLVAFRQLIDMPRAVALEAGPGAIVGLAGNLPEYVIDEANGRLLLAGGHYRFPAEFCTLDSFLDAAWQQIEFRMFRDVPGPVPKVAEESLDTLHRESIAGFRVVRQLGLP